MFRIILLFALFCDLPLAHASSLDFALGKALFDRPWASAPASTQAADGLGPLFNARSCLACHPKGGRGHLQLQKDGTIDALGFVLRLGSAAGLADPTYGQQLQTNAIQGHQAEGTVLFDNDFNAQISSLAYGPLAAKIQSGGRLAQDLHGLGLLAAVPDSALMALADPDDQNQDGISGRINWHPSPEGGKAIGRFAWKATAVTLHQQSAMAFSNDIGMSTPILPAHGGDCTAAQPQCLAGPHGDSPQFDNVEISAEMLRLVTAYVEKLPAPKPLNDPNGLAIFTQVGCAACHRPTLPLDTGETIQPYTDLLLHDMGDVLSDGIREGDAAPSEWRTAPLWGLRHAKNFLHDGRAQSLEQAITLHGGEAQKARNAFTALPPADKNRLLTFLSGL